MDASQAPRHRPSSRVLLPLLADARWTRRKLRVRHCNLVSVLHFLLALDGRVASSTAQTSITRSPSTSRLRSMAASQAPRQTLQSRVLVPLLADARVPRRKLRGWHCNDVSVFQSVSLLADARLPRRKLRGRHCNHVALLHDHHFPCAAS